MGGGFNNLIAVLTIILVAAGATWLFKKRQAPRQHNDSHTLEKRPMSVQHRLPVAQAGSQEPTAPIQEVPSPVKQDLQPQIQIVPLGEGTGEGEKNGGDEDTSTAVEADFLNKPQVESHCKDEARAAAEYKAQRQAEEARRAREEARAAAEQEAQRQAEEARLAAEQEAQRRAEEARRRAEEGARAAAERDELSEAEDAQRCSQVKVTSPLPGPAAPPLGPRTPRQYRPTARTPAPQRAPLLPSEERQVRNRAMPIELRLVFEKAGFCQVSLLPRRTAGMPAEFAVKGSGSPPELEALQDEWYQDVMLPDIGQLLREGVEWVGPLPGGGAARLSLSGRGIFVLARHGELNGFVSTTRLVLGEEHVVLCVSELLPEVRAAIALTESPEPSKLNSDSGIPIGWVGLHGVRPRKPVAPSPSGDIIDPLRPLPDVRIALTGGIRIDRQTWLTGFPPTIKLLGDVAALGIVTIDGQEATQSPKGNYVVPGWDSSGEHTVWCTSASRTYAIRSGAEFWEPWDAYVWSLGEPTATGTQSRPAICGALVRPPRAARTDSRPTVVAASNPILIGARPGEIEICTPRSEVRAGLCVGFPWFEPIWAIPADALHCDKRTARVLLIGPTVAVNSADHESSMQDRGSAARRRTVSWGSHAWCEAILAASRKGLQTEPLRFEIADLWRSYNRYAKALRRSWR